MEISAEIRQAAEELGSVLSTHPAVQALKEAEAALESSVEIQELDAELNRVYEDLVRRQQGGEVLSPVDTNRFYKLRDRLYNHPLVVERNERLKLVKSLFEQAGSTISSILTVDFTALVE